MAITKATASSIAPAAKGDLVVGSATNDASVLAVGSANQVLTVDSSTATGLKWAAPAAGGKVLQVVQGTDGGTISSSSASYVSTGLTATITPTAATSKILIIVTTNISTDSSSDGGKATLYRGNTSTGTNLAGGDDFFQYFFDQDTLSYWPVNMSYLDSPSTTSATTYTCAFKRMLGTVSALGGLQTMVLMEVGA